MLIRNVPTLAHCALCNMITAIGLTMRSHMPNIYIRLHMPNFHFDLLMPFPLLVYWAWECEASWVLTDVSCLLLNKLTMAVALICVPNIFFCQICKPQFWTHLPLTRMYSRFKISLQVCSVSGGPLLNYCNKYLQVLFVSICK